MCVSVLVMVRRCSGRSFHALGAATLKARSPNFRRVLGTCRSDFVAVASFSSYGQTGKNCNAAYFDDCIKIGTRHFSEQ